MTLPINTTRPSLAQLPNDYCIELSDFSAISLAGEEQSKYLQGQVTCDVNSLAENGLTNGAHCDAKGKVFSVFRLINRAGAHLLLQNKASLTPSIEALKKFGVFAKVEITETTQLQFFALTGEQAASEIKAQYQQLPDSLTPVVEVADTTIVYIAGQQARYILIAEAGKLESFISALDLPIYQQKIWDLLEISEGFPVLTTAAISEYVPQMINVQAIHGISFTKGCYLGQETVARMQYLGKNKRALFSLTGVSTQTIQAGDIVEMQLGENWRKAGSVITSYRADTGEESVQVVLSSDIEEETILRIKADEKSALKLKSLPYALITSEA